jgi:hypothetical protein
LQETDDVTEKSHEWASKMRSKLSGFVVFADAQLRSSLEGEVDENVQEAADRWLLRHPDVAM